VIFIPPGLDRWPLDRLIPYAGNSKKHPPDQIDAIERSMVEFGFCDPIGVDEKNGQIIEGHGRLMAGMRLHKKGLLDEAPIVKLGHLTPLQQKAYRIAHNKLQERGGGHDHAKLLAEVGFIKDGGLDLALTGLSPKELRLDVNLDNTPIPQNDNGQAQAQFPVLSFSHYKVGMTQGEIEHLERLYLEWVEVNGSGWGFVTSILGVNDAL